MAYKIARGEVRGVCADLLRACREARRLGIRIEVEAEINVDAQ